jgi:hypothetical protein
MTSTLVALRTVVILRRPQSGRLEGRSALIQPIFNFFARSKVQGDRLDLRPWVPAFAGMTSY